MKYRKPLAIAAVTAGLIVGGANVAAAGEGSRGDDAETASVRQANFDGNRGDRGNRLETVAEVLDIDAEDIRTQLQDGATLAEIAEDNGSSADELVDALVANIEERLDNKVEEGELTEEETDERLEAITERVTNKVNGVETGDGERRHSNRRGNRHGADSSYGEAVES